MLTRKSGTQVPIDYAPSVERRDRITLSTRSALRLIMLVIVFSIFFFSHRIFIS